jgi:hypothetical protein
MIRTASALVALFMLASARPGADVDAMVFARAFRAGTADQYRNVRIAGRGVNFHGEIAERIADGTTRTSLVITLGAATDFDHDLGRVRRCRTRPDDPGGRAERSESVGPVRSRSPALRILRCVRRPGAHDRARA